MRKPNSSTPSLRILGVLLPALLLTACGPSPGPPSEGPDADPDSALSGSRKAADAGLVDGEFLTARMWNDGKAEVAFYEVRRNRNQYGEEADQSFVVGSYLVKHGFDVARMSKATGEGESIASFKYALFYEFESKSYQYKRAYVTNAEQRTLAPLKSSFTMFDWCSNTYEELSFPADGGMRLIRRTDDYGNREEQLPVFPGAFPVAEVPLVMRALRVAEGKPARFIVIDRDGSLVDAEARRVGEEDVSTPAGRFATERLELRLAREVSSPIGERTDTLETYWRSTGPERLLVAIQGSTGRYRMELQEALRSPYWNEDLWPRLQRVTTRP